MVGNVPVGGNAPITVQTMTNTKTTDVAATVEQIQRIERVGADIVRVSVPTMEAAEAFKLIKQQTRIPIVADIHFDYRIALKVAEYGADCLRINPGNIGNEERVRAVVDCARHYNIPIRIGVNGGSLEKDIQEKYGEPTPEALLESAMRHVDYLDRLNFENFKVSVKASDVFLAVGAYRLLAKQIEQPLHLGITEAGGFRAGAVKSAIGLGMLLAAIVFAYPLLFMFAASFKPGDAIFTELGSLIATLHRQGIYFRSLHLGNIVLTPENKMGLIDLADLSRGRGALGTIKRLRNFQHLLRDSRDRNTLNQPEAIACFDRYCQESSLAPSGKILKHRLQLN